jgi:4'-phosphopantetheinyl transferase
MPLGPGEVDIWWSVLDSQADTKTLSSDELSRANRFRFARDRERFIAAHVMLRSVLARYMGVAPELLQFQAAAHGKPHLAGASPVSFNLSHSGELTAVAVSRGRQVGIDVEQVREVDDIDRVCRLIASPAEERCFRQLPEASRAVAFFSCWTRKEAVVKAMGAGLSQPLDRIEVSLSPEVCASLLEVDGSPWSVFSFTLMPGYAAALAAQGRDLTPPSINRYL